jgi:hypothetical protein
LDLLGAFLQIATKDECKKLFGRFAKLGKIKVKIYYILTLQDLKENGIRFNKEDYVYETNIFSETRQNVENLEEIDLKGGILPKLKYNGYKYPAKIGDLKVVGIGKMYKKHNLKNDTYFVKGTTDLTIKNEILGEYKLSKEKVYKFKFGPVGRNPAIFREVLWISTKKAKELFGSDERMREVIQKI